MKIGGKYFLVSWILLSRNIIDNYSTHIKNLQRIKYKYV